MAETNQQQNGVSPMEAVREAATAIQQSKNVDDDTRNDKLKVSVLSGFLGAGKTTGKYIVYFILVISCVLS